MFSLSFLLLCAPFCPGFLFDNHVCITAVYDNRLNQITIYLFISTPLFLSVISYLSDILRFNFKVKLTPHSGLNSALDLRTSLSLTML